MQRVRFTAANLLPAAVEVIDAILKSATPTALVVSTVEAQRALVASWLAAEAYQCEQAGGFAEARHSLERRSPDVLIADVKLGTYNGIHLAIWARSRGLSTRLMVIGEPDPVLEMEAKRVRAGYLAAPLTRAALAEYLSSPAVGTARQAQRRRVRLDASVGSCSVNVVDVSASGVRLELAAEPMMTFPEFFTLTVAQVPEVLRFRRVWVRYIVERHVVVCGASLVSRASACLDSWEEFAANVQGPLDSRVLVTVRTDA